MQNEENGRRKAPRDIQERAFDFACLIVRLHRELVQRDVTARTLAGQLLRSGTAIGANLEEAHAGQTKPDFIAKCSIALKEARETLYWLRLFRATGIANNETIDPLHTEAHELVSILTTILRNARANNLRGPK